MRKRELCCDQRYYVPIHVYIRSLATSWMIAHLTIHKILNKRRIRGLVYQTRSSVIFIGPGLLGFLDRGLCVFNVFGKKERMKELRMKVSDSELCNLYRAVHPRIFR